MLTTFSSQAPHCLKKTSEGVSSAAASNIHGMSSLDETLARVNTQLAGLLVWHLLAVSAGIALLQCCVWYLDLVITACSSAHQGMSMQDWLSLTSRQLHVLQSALQEERCGADQVRQLLAYEEARRCDLEESLDQAHKNAKDQQRTLQNKVGLNYLQPLGLRQASSNTGKPQEGLVIMLWLIISLHVLKQAINACRDAFSACSFLTAPK